MGREDPLAPPSSRPQLRPRLSHPESLYPADNDVSPLPSPGRYFTLLCKSLYLNQYGWICPSGPSLQGPPWQAGVGFSRKLLSWAGLQVPIPPSLIPCD